MNQKAACPRCTHVFEVPGELYNTTVICPSCNGEFNPMTEYVKAGIAAVQRPEFQESFKADVIVPANTGISHEEFVTGVRNRTIGFKYPFGEPSELLTGTRKIRFSLLVMLYQVAPFIFIPLWAWHENNWWLLLGIAVSRIATQIGVRSLTWTKEAGTFLGGLLFVGCAILGTFVGVHNYYAFFTFCTLWGYTLFRIAEKSQNQNALQSLIESSVLFHEAIAQNKIMIVRK